METRGLRLTVALVAVALFTLACSSGIATRRSAVVPLPEGPARSGRPLDHGEVRFSGYVAQALGGPDARVQAPQVGDPGVLVPRTVAGFSIYGGVTDRLELGVSVAGGAERSLAPNFRGGGVIPFASGPSIRFAPGVRGNFPIGERLTLSLIAETGVAAVPQAVYECTNAAQLDRNPSQGVVGGDRDPGEPATGWCTTRDEFRMVEKRTHSEFVGALVAETVVAIDAIWATWARAGLVHGVRNNGFQAEEWQIIPGDDPPLQPLATVVAGIGAEARPRNLVVGVNFDLLVPLERAMSVMPVVTLRLGARIPGREHRRSAP